MKIFATLFALLLASCVGMGFAELPARGPTTKLCGEYFFDGGDRVALSTVSNQSAYLIRDRRVYAYFRLRRHGGVVRVLAERVDPCADDRSTEAACLQSASEAYLVLRPLRDGESC
jgi:hypothetical protein